MLNENVAQTAAGNAPLPLPARLLLGLFERIERGSLELRFGAGVMRRIRRSSAPVAQLHIRRPAAMLARCESPRFFGVSGLLYEKQKEWLDSRDPVQIADNLRKLGKVAGLADDRIEACLSDADKATALVAWFEKNREADGIDSTPSLVINGTKYTNMAYSELKALIDKELGAE